jgi:hypothetical protein
MVAYLAMMWCLFISLNHYPSPQSPDIMESYNIQGFLTWSVVLIDRCWKYGWNLLNFEDAYVTIVGGNTSPGECPREDHE